MEKADADFIHQLFQENNELRAKYNTRQREVRPVETERAGKLYNKTVQCEAAEEEIRQLKIRLETESKPTSRPTVREDRSQKVMLASRVEALVTDLVWDPGSNSDSRRPCPKSKVHGIGRRLQPWSAELFVWSYVVYVVAGTPTTPGTVRDLDEAMFSIEKKTAEVKALKEDLATVQGLYEDERRKHEVTTLSLTDAQEELTDLRQFRANALREAEIAAADSDPPAGRSEVVPDDVLTLTRQLKMSEATCEQLRKQIISIAIEANRKHNEQQNQLQGVEALISGVRGEYDEFIQITKLENDSYRSTQQAEYDALRKEFDGHKLQQFDEKKRIMAEYQSQFDEYRITSEFLFNAEMGKLEDEMMSLSGRYEQEILYVIQAKDKFYADMMVAKDAKIMSLIEGSDLQNLMQKHEMDMSNLRKEHVREVERVKSDQESEQKNFIALLQRQNLSLESKCDKLQAHMKTLEIKIKELLSTIDSKNKTISEREETRIKSEAEFQTRLDESVAKINALSREKEHLRHKVIRLNLDAKGDGQNSIENMLKRLARETNDLRFDYEETGVKYDHVLSENQILTKRLKEVENLVQFLEKELSRRTDEYQGMTRTFEEFLTRRVAQSKKDRKARLLRLYGTKKAKTAEKDINDEDDDVTLTPKIKTVGNLKKITKAQIPDVGDGGPAVPSETVIAAERQAELQKGLAYLRRFKTLSRAFANGDFRALPGIENPHPTDALPGPWQKTALYSKLDDANLAMARFYGGGPAAEDTNKPTLYNGPDALKASNTIEFWNPKVVTRGKRKLSIFSINGGLTLLMHQLKPLKGGDLKVYSEKNAMPTGEAAAAAGTPGSAKHTSKLSDKFSIYFFSPGRPPRTHLAPSALALRIPAHITSSTQALAQVRDHVYVGARNMDCYIHATGGHVRRCRDSAAYAESARNGAISVRAGREAGRAGQEQPALPSSLLAPGTDSSLDYVPRPQGKVAHMMDSRRLRRP
ncbi:hypothetical protein BDK51DRAFT_42737 [Blyttiomyces helicus]|uniref:Uncharacterized protein n=1 Tax=Blyttiomyces helicus TaxID=388810 RepID=A0A4V1ISE0_9FUNG|nr:hypothetical protein BDK51DRAFT_42737 [Blyttiomyces helicus]|eukprot:RKO93227.1 hypothetical protein BDK51DRAFT_42737 [Blyttiomyces helicus]